MLLFFSFFSLLVSIEYEPFHDVDFNYPPNEISIVEIIDYFDE